MDGRMSKKGGGTDGGRTREEGAPAVESDGIQGAAGPEKGGSAARSVWMWSALASFFACVVAIAMIAWGKGAHLDYLPFNGTFQNFNPLRRMAAGEVPGRDFTIYLGFGPTLAAWPLFKILGSDYSASNMAHSAMAHLSWWGCLWTLLVLGGLGRAKAAVFSSLALLWFLRFSPPLSVLTLPFTSLLWSSDSAMGLRSALAPFSIGLAVLLRLRRPALFESSPGGAVLGALAGLGVLWSNDYGPATALGAAGFALLAPVAAPAAARLPLRAQLVRFSAFLAAAAAAPCAFLWAWLGGAGALDWAKENYRDIASAQDWFYLNVFEHKVYELDQIVWPEFILASLFSVLYLSLLAARRRDPKLLALAAILGASFLGAYVPSLAGTGQVRYFAGLLRTAYVALPVCVLYAALPVLPRVRLPSFLGGALRAAGFAFAAAAAAGCAALAFPLAADTSSGWFPRLRAPSVAPVEARELGGGASILFSRLVEKAREIRAKSDAAGLGPKERVFSTYSTGFDVVAGAFQPTRSDYVIHAMGKDRSLAYAAAAGSGAAPWATTLNPEIVGWEPWIEREAWAAHRGLFLAYEPVEDFGPTRLWRRRPSPLVPLGDRLSCRIERVSESEADVVVEGGSKTNGIVYADLTLAYAASVVPSGVPWLGTRGVVEVRELSTGTRRAFGQGPWSSYALPVSGSPGDLVLVHDPDSASRLRLKVWPDARGRLEEASCSASSVLRASDVRPPAPPRPAFEVQAKIVHDPDASAPTPILRSLGLSVRFDPEIQKLRLGDEASSPCFGKARILSIDGFWTDHANVWLEAEAGSCPADTEFPLRFESAFTPNPPPPALRP